VNVLLRPRLLSDNGSCYLSHDLENYLQRKHIEHTRGAPYHPMTQGKIERYHRSMKNMVYLQNYYSPEELERELTHFLDYYNNQWYHESLDNLTQMDVYTGRSKEVLTKRAEIKKGLYKQNACRICKCKQCKYNNLGPRKCLLVEAGFCLKFSENAQQSAAYIYYLIFVGYALRMSVTPYMDSLRRDFSLSYSQAGLVFSAFIIGKSLSGCPLVFGPISMGVDGS